MAPGVHGEQDRQQVCHGAGHSEREDQQTDKPKREGGPECCGRESEGDQEWEEQGVEARRILRAEDT